MGGLILLLILVATGCIVVCVWLTKCQQRKYTSSTNVVYDRKGAENHFELSMSDCEVITDDNIAYECSQPKNFENNDEVKMAPTGHRHSEPSIVDQTTHEHQPLTEELKHDLNMEQNVAYNPTVVHNMSPNVAYGDHDVQRSQRGHEISMKESDYDYVIT